MTTDNSLSTNDKNMLTFISCPATLTPMNTQTEMKLKRIEQISVLLRAACTGLLILVGIVVGVAVVAMVAGRVTSVKNGSETFIIADLSLKSRLVLMGASLAAAAVLVKGLVHLRRLLNNYSRRQIFTADSAREIRQFG